jgi:hypothetical protein
MCARLGFFFRISGHALIEVSIPIRMDVMDSTSTKGACLPHISFAETPENLKYVASGDTIGGLGRFSYGKKKLCVIHQQLPSFEIKIKNKL